MKCLTCGGEAYLLGNLGILNWFRCRACGMDFNLTAEDYKAVKKSERKAKERANIEGDQLW